MHVVLFLVLMVNVYTFRGSNSAILMFAPCLVELSMVCVCRGGGVDGGEGNGSTLISRFFCLMSIFAF